MVSSKDWRGACRAEASRGGSESLIGLDMALVVSLAVAAVFGFVAPVGLALFLHFRLGAPWRFLVYGAMVFFVSQLAVRAPILQVVKTALGPSVESSTTALIGWLFFAALTAGLVEEVGRYAGYRFLFKGERTWRNGLMYGAGHGGLEALVFGGISMAFTLANYVAIANMDPAQSSLSPEQLAQFEAARDIFAQLEWWTPLAGGFERGAALATQLSLSIMVLQVFLRRDIRWLFGTIAYHTLIDFSAVLAGRYLGILPAEALVGAFAVVGIVLIMRLRTPDEDAVTPGN